MPVTLTQVNANEHGHVQITICGHVSHVVIASKLAKLKDSYTCISTSDATPYIALQEFEAAFTILGHLYSYKTNINGYSMRFEGITAIYW